MTRSADSKTPQVAQSVIAAGLTRLGIEAGDAVLVHSSLRSFGHVVGGPDVVIDALLEVVGHRGVVVMPTLTLGASENPVAFDVRNSPSTSGRITEVFRKRPEARRSHHPTSSAAAIGRGADVLTGYHIDTPCGLTSPYGQVYLRDGWCLFLGTAWHSNTMFHTAEEIAMPAYLRMAEFRDTTLIDEEGVPHAVAFRRYNCYQSGVQRDLEKMGSLYEAAGAVRHTRIGLSECFMIRARDVIDITVRLIQQSPEEVFSYCTTPQS